MSVQSTRRAFLWGAGGLAASAALTACGAPGGSSKSGGSSGDEEVDELIFMTNSQDAMGPVHVEMWNAGDPPFPVQLRTTDSAQYGNSFPRIATSDDAPHIAGYFVDGGHFTDLARAGALMDMTEFWEVSGLMDNVPELIRQQYSSFTDDGRMYGAPTNTSRYGCFFYRKSVLAEAGVPFPVDHAFSSEEEFVEAAETLKAAGIDPISIGGKDGYPISHLQDGLLASTMAPEQILDPLSIDYLSPEWMRPVEKLLEWERAGYFAPGFLGRTTDQGNAHFAQGRAGFSTGMNVWIPLLVEAGIDTEDLDWCLLPPIGELETKISIYAGGGIVIPEIAPGHAQAVEFGTWLVSPETALHSAEEGQVIPARTDVPDLVEVLGPLAGSMYELGEQDGRFQFGWDDPAPTNMINYDRENLQAVLSGGQSVRDFCEQLEQLKRGHA
ncbi:extracellular solute-binding protein [Streptomyces sp. 3MP-14]|uniref:Extracellular solute-binding protein n=1 Tax=Streptomyces mimosae TaxID=2586635 RepID=A0A5N6AEC8_9ACTN|nr:MULTISPECIES: ABC transporter substrate-binding protein [Streptomyces]KAB8166326.1 extracellular solute-binding protein [Streptomyces mimosae]KAB8174119.1 extracellular solute-binding protein [Streptomyces sp. 3MP-14]